jgi:hypothetical protein
VTYEVDAYEKRREDNKIPSHNESLLLLEEEQIEWKSQPPAQIGYQDYAAWTKDEVRQSICDIPRTSLIPGTEMGSLE